MLRPFIRELRDRPDQLGVIAEDRLRYAEFDKTGVQCVGPEDEVLLMHAMHQTFVGTRAGSPAKHRRTVYSSCFQLTSDYGVRRCRIHCPGSRHTRFSGFLDDVYATLIVRLHHAPGFEMKQLWRDYAEFCSETGRELYIELSRDEEGCGAVKLHCHHETGEDTRVLFSRYVHEHLAEKARDVNRSRHYICSKCGKPYTDDEEIREAIEEDGDNAWVPCARRKCDERIPLWDAIEQKFASDEFRERVRQLRKQSQYEIDNESRELMLIGDAFTVAGRAGQIFRPTPNADHGIDGEIEFKDAGGKATNRRLYLQLKHGDSYLDVRKRDGREIFRIKKERHAEYWVSPRESVMLVIRTSDDRIRWMNVTRYLQRQKDAGNWPVKQIEFEGEDFNADAVLRWRSLVLGLAKD